MLPKNLIIFWLKYKDTDKNTLDDFDTLDDPRGEKIQTEKYLHETVMAVARITDTR
jgi:hypothetical protein